MVEVDPLDAWLTILSSGRCYREMRQALADLGLASDDDVRGAGIRLVRLGMIYPVEPGVLRAAARGVQELLVVEEKRPFIERFAREQLYDLAERPRVTGKRDEQDRPLIPVDGELTADEWDPFYAGFHFPGGAGWIDTGDPDPNARPDLETLHARVRNALDN